MAARSRGPPRPTTSRASERAKSGAASELAESAGAASASATKAPTASSRRVDRGGIGQRRRQPLREQPRAGRRHRAVDRREQRAAPLARERAISSRLARVAASIDSVAPALSRAGGDSGGRLPSCVRST